ncbi:unnamed protein product [Symbiodinium sp. CCMP2592]|nr:unnamed protein product [Symbiodinium sp. CCMP2592]
MASDRDPLADWLKTLPAVELERLREAHSVSAQAAVDTAVPADARPSDNPYGLSPRSLLIYQNQEAYYHAQDGCYTGPIPDCFDYVPPQDTEDLEEADTAQPSQPSAAAVDAEPTALGVLIKGPSFYPWILGCPVVPFFHLVVRGSL